MMRPGARLPTLAALGKGILFCILGGASQRMPGDIGAMDASRTAAYLGWTGAALGLAVLCKLLPAALLPALWRRWDLRV